MRKISWCVVCLSLLPLLSACPPVANPDLGGMRITNASSRIMTALYFGPSGEDLGANRLGSSLSPGFSRTIINLPVGVSYDFRAEFGPHEVALFEATSFLVGEVKTWRIRNADLSDERVTAEILSLESDLLDLVNTERSDAELSALTMPESLRLIARAHSHDMIARDFFDTENPDGADYQDRLVEGGIDFEIAGENLGFLDAIGTVFVEDMLDFWLEDVEGAVLNMLDPEFAETGIGAATDGDGYYVFTQVFVDQSGAARKIRSGGFVIQP